MNTACIVVLTEASAAGGTAAHPAIASHTLRNTNDITTRDDTIEQYASKRGGSVSSAGNGVFDQMAAQKWR